jgi:ATP synthase protein I
MTTPAGSPKQKRALSETMRELGALSTVGFSFVLAIVIGFGAGVLLDRWLGTNWLWIVFFVFGLVAGILNVYRTAGKFLK